jgi:hypothetical protein
MLVLGAAGMLLGYFALLLEPPLAGVVGIRLFAGLAEAAFVIAAYTVVTDIAPEARRGEAISLATVASYLGLAAETGRRRLPARRRPLSARLAGRGGLHRARCSARVDASGDAPLERRTRARVAAPSPCAAPRRDPFPGARRFRRLQRIRGAVREGDRLRATLVSSSHCSGSS